MSVVLGRNVNVYAYYNGTWEILGCATGCTLTTTQDIAEITTVDSGINKEYKGIAFGWSVSFDGLIFLDIDFGVSHLYNLQASLLPLNLSIEMEDTDGNVKTYSGTTLIENIDQTGQDNSAASFTASFRGSGGLTVSSDPVDPNSGGVERYDYEAIGGESEFSAAELINKDILAVFHDTDSYAISTSSASNQVALYTVASGTISFDFLLTPGSKIAVLYQ